MKLHAVCCEAFFITVLSIQQYFVEEKSLQEMLVNNECTSWYNRVGYFCCRCGTEESKILSVLVNIIIGTALCCFFTFYYAGIFNMQYVYNKYTVYHIVRNFYRCKSCWKSCFPFRIYTFAVFIFVFPCELIAIQHVQRFMCEKFRL